MVNVCNATCMYVCICMEFEINLEMYDGFPRFFTLTEKRQNDQQKFYLPAQFNLHSVDNIKASWFGGC